MRLAGFELRRFFRGRLPAAALVVVAVIPLLYGALYLYAFWDPYGHLNHIPAALVVEDIQATATDGTKVQAGRDLADELIEREVFDWHVTDARGAEAGLADGSYQIALRIPRDFSANLTTGPDADAVPKSAQLIVLSDDATNYLSGVFSRTAFEEVRVAAAQSAQVSYFDKMLIGFTDLKKQTQEAADGAGKLDDGLTDASTGADRLEGGLNNASRGQASSPAASAAPRAARATSPTGWPRCSPARRSSPRARDRPPTAASGWRPRSTPPPTGSSRCCVTTPSASRTPRTRPRTAPTCSPATSAS
nr:hypothetical protein GCM10020092_018340 [Actinoplanes digitatis]